MREEGEGRAERDRFSVVTDILSDVAEGEKVEERDFGQWEQRHPLPLGQQRRRYRILRQNNRGPIVAAVGERKGSTPSSSSSSSPCVIRFCVSHSKTCDKDSAVGATRAECQAAMSSTATTVVTTAAAGWARITEESGDVLAAVRNMSAGDGGVGGGGDIVTVTTVSKAIRPWDIATVVSSSGKRWVFFVGKRI